MEAAVQFEMHDLEYIATEVELSIRCQKWNAHGRSQKHKLVKLLDPKTSGWLWRTGGKVFKNSTGRVRQGFSKVGTW